MTVRYRSKRAGTVAEYDSPFGPYERSDNWERIENEPEAPKPEPKPEPEPTPEPAPRRRPGRPRKAKAGE